MKYFIASVLLFFAASVVCAQQNMQLWYNQPAAVWSEALPVGNGKLGAMVFGGVENELLQLNEATLRTVGPIPNNVNHGPEH